MSPTPKPAIIAGKTQVLGSITVIDTPLVTRAMDYARTHSEPFLFNHAVRSWLKEPTQRVRSRASKASTIAACS